MATEALYPALLQDYADGFSRMECPLDMLDETLSILYMFYDPTMGYNIQVKLGELADRRAWESPAALKTYSESYIDYYNCVILLLDLVEKEERAKAVIDRIYNVSSSLITMSGGTTENTRKTCADWLGKVLAALMARFRLPENTPDALEEFLNKTFDSFTANLIYMCVAYRGMLAGVGAVQADLLETIVSTLFLLTAKMNVFRKQAIQAYETMEKLAGESEPGRNDPCPCGSGKKYKNCCLMS